MKKIFLISIAVLTFFISATNVKAEGEIEIDLKIYENGQEVFDGPLTVAPCLLPGSAEDAVPATSAYCAVEQSGVSASWSQFGSDWYLDSVDGTGADFSQNLYWAVFYDLEYATDSMSAHILSDGEEMLLAYNSYPLKIEGDNSPTINEETIFTVYQFGLDESFNPVWNPIPGATVFLNGEEIGITNESGDISLTLSSSEEKTLSATLPNATPSAPFNIEAVFLEINVDIIIATSTETIFDGEVSIAPCSNQENGGELSYNAYCVLQEVTDNENLTLDASWSDFGVFVNGIDSYSSDFANNLFWLTFSNRTPMDLALNNEIVEEGDEIILSYGTTPLKISASNVGPLVGETVQITAEFFDGNIWSYAPAVNAVFAINGVQTLPEADGILDLLISSDEPYVISATLSPYIESREITIEGTAIDNGGGGGGDENEEENGFDVDQAVSFLLSNQEENGSFGSDLYTDWVAIALSSSDDASGSLKQYIIDDTNPGNLFQDLLRRAMALMALGVSPYDGTDRNYIEDIISEFDGTQFGDDDIFNDDLFAVLVLTHAGFDSGSEEISKAVEFILGAQKESGELLGVDVTSAGIQILSLVDDISGVDEALEKAEEYLRSVQNSNGGFANSFATSWTLQAIGALGQSPSDWEKDGNNPLDYLATLQEEDGGVESPSTSIQNRIWATAYAIPGALGKPWDEILENFEKESGDNENITNNESSNNTEDIITPEVLGEAIEIPKVEPILIVENNFDDKVVSKKIVSEIKTGEVLGESDEVSLDPEIPPSLDVKSKPLKSSVVLIIFGAVILGAFLIFRRK